MNRGPLSIDPIAEARRQWIVHGWADAADGMAAVASVMRVQQLMLARVDTALKPFDLSFARFELLALLSFTRDGVLPMASASARLQVHPTSLTSTVNRLERDGLVRREPHPTDGRATLIVLEDAGRDLAARATEALNREVFEHPQLEPDDLKALMSILARYRLDAGDFSEPRPQPEPL